MGFSSWHYYGYLVQLNVIRSQQIEPKVFKSEYLAG